MVGALPYIDDDYRIPNVKEEVDTLVEEEMRRSIKKPADFLKELPPAPKLNFEQNTAVELNALSAQWKELCEKNIEIEAASAKTEIEVDELKRKAAERSIHSDFHHPLDCDNASLESDEIVFPEAGAWRVTWRMALCTQNIEVVSYGQPGVLQLCVLCAGPQWNKSQAAGVHHEFTIANHPGASSISSSFVDLHPQKMANWQSPPEGTAKINSVAAPSNGQSHGS